MQKIKKLFTEMRTELLKVSWPSRNEISGSTLIVAIFSIITAIFIGLIDSVFANIIKRIIA